LCTEYWHHIHPPSPFPYILPLPLVTTPRQNLFCFPVSALVRKHGVFVCIR
jgi:hypothetical protein